MEKILNIKQQLKLLPDLPGVYLMKDATGDIIYIGKAKNLKNRVRSYFNKKLDTPKLCVMVPKIVKFEFIVTDTEVEALILESHLIKKHKPTYNVLLKDDKKFPWFVITDEEYPRIVISRRSNKNQVKGRYFGPYTNGRAMYSTLDLIKKLFPLRQCKTPRFGNRTCMYYDIGKCSGLCQKKISPEDYKEIVNQVALFLTGRQEKLLDEIKNQMENYAQNQQYEKAARYRDSYFDVKRVIERQKVVSENTKIDWDVVGFSQDGNTVGIVILKVRSGRLIDKNEFELDSAGFEERQEAVEMFVKEYYSMSNDIPAEIILPDKVADEDVLLAWLKSRRKKTVSFTVPKVQKKFDMLELANKNANLFVERLKAQQAAKMHEDWNSIGAYIQQKLNLKKFPHRIECFDISHIQGTNTVASMVVFENGCAKKSDYKRYKIRSVKEGKPDDFASMSEVVQRRYKRLIKDQKPLPDLIIVDGGKGQLSSSVKILENLGVSEQQDIVSLAKRLEEVFVPKKSLPIILPMNSQAMFLFQKIRDEAHRFAVNYHRRLRENQALESVLDEVKGISSKKKKLLFDKFGDMKTILQAEKSQLQEVLGMATGNRLYNYLSDFS